MAFDQKILEVLLRREEGPALDFKQEQYPFENASENDKAELLKDILALANSLRLTNGYILIGVKEVKAGPSEIVGVEKHLDDANLHQFVNGKTQRAVQFSYVPFRVADVEIGVIEVESQRRPFFLKKKFGKLQSNEVWIRDGSASRIANPDEIADMGSEQVVGQTPNLTLELVDIENRVVYGSSHIVHSLILKPSLPADTFQSPIASPLSSENPNYSREVITCTRTRNFLKPVGFRLRNDSGVVGKRIRFVGGVSKERWLVVTEDIEPIPWLHQFDHLSDIKTRWDHDGDDPTMSLRDSTDRVEINIDFGNIRPHDESWMDEPLYFGSVEPGDVTIEGELRGDNISVPIKCKLEIQFQVEQRPMKKDDAFPFLREG